MKCKTEVQGHLRTKPLKEVEAEALGRGQGGEDTWPVAREALGCAEPPLCAPCSPPQQRSGTRLRGSCRSRMFQIWIQSEEDKLSGVPL